LKTDKIQIVYFVLYPHFRTPYSVDEKINGSFGFVLPRNIVSDICVTCYNRTVCTFHFEATFQPSDEADLNNNDRFTFCIPKNNIEIDI